MASEHRVAITEIVACNIARSIEEVESDSICAILCVTISSNFKQLRTILRVMLHHVARPSEQRMRLFYQ